MQHTKPPLCNHITNALQWWSTTLPHPRYHLGLVMEGMEGEAETAANCFATAQAMEASAPVLPFSTIPLAFE